MNDPSARKKRAENKRSSRRVERVGCPRCKILQGLHDRGAVCGCPEVCQVGGASASPARKERYASMYCWIPSRSDAYRGVQPSCRSAFSIEITPRNEASTSSSAV